MVQIRAEQEEEKIENRKAEAVLKKRPDMRRTQLL